MEALKTLGLKIAVVHGVDDAFFPMKRVQEHTTRDRVDGFYSVEVTHNQLYLHPEKYTHLVDFALDALEAARRKEERAEE